MSTQAKQGYGSTLALILFGVLTLSLGTRWLVILVPAAMLVWYAAPRFKSGRD